MDEIAKDTHGRRQREIAMAARALIAEQGFEGLRTRDIAARVGINIATLHYHVPGKEALVALLAQSLRDEFVAVHEDHPRDGLTPLQTLRLELDEFIEIRRERPEIHQVYGELMIRARRDPAVAAIMQPMTDHWHNRLAAILAQGVAEGLFRASLIPEAAAGMIIGALTWRGRNACAPPVPLESIADELMRAVLANPA